MEEKSKKVSKGREIEDVSELERTGSPTKLTSEISVDGIKL